MVNQTQVSQNPIYVSIDIGTTKIVALAARMNKHGKLDIVGHGRTESTGVLRGVVSNIEKTVAAITQAVAEAEQAAGTRFKNVVVGIAGQHIKSLLHTGMVTRANDTEEIRQADIDRLINDIYKMVLPAGDKILHVIPQEFVVDNEQGIMDPVGMYGVRLDGRFQVITGQSTAANNINRCLERSGMKMNGPVLESIASSMAVLTDEEREAGVAVLDLGGGTSDLIIYKDGVIRYTASIALGGNLVTSDVKEGCTIMQNSAEILKVRYGSALADEITEPRIITIPTVTGRVPREVNEQHLAMIIQARMEDIFEAALLEIQKSGFERKLVAGIVLTGGGANLRHVDWLCEEVMGISTRIGRPHETLAQGYNKELSGPDYSTAIGLLLYAMQNNWVTAPVEVAPEPAQVTDPEIIEPLGFEQTTQEPKGALSGWFKGIRDFFESEPDRELD
jgi:cell division protein FtsA